MPKISAVTPYITWRNALILALTLLGLSLVIVGTLLGFRGEQASILHEVQSRGYLRCGVGGGLEAFSSEVLGENGNRIPFRADVDPVYYKDALGIDADFCRVIATAIFGTSEGRLAFRNLSISERFEGVVDGSVDVMVRNTTWTLNRDALYPLDFGIVVFHDAQQIMTRKSLDISLMHQFDGHNICVLDNTTTITNLQNAIGELGISPKIITGRSSDNLWQNNDDIAANYFGGGNVCDAWTGDGSQLVSYLATQPEEIQALHTILPVNLSYEPLTPVIPANDSLWRDVINAAVWSTMQAEALGISQNNVDEMRQSSSPSIKGFLGVESDGSSLGENLSLEPDFAYQIIQHVGNYADIYARNLGDLIPERGWNQLYPDGRLQPPPS